MISQMIINTNLTIDHEILEETVELISHYKKRLTVHALIINFCFLVM